MFKCLFRIWNLSVLRTAAALTAVSLTPALAHAQTASEEQAPADEQANASAAADAPSPEGIKFFEEKIRPVLVDQCYRCHSADGQGVRGGLAVDSREALAIGGESGPAVVPSNLEESILWNAINYQDYKMPPGGPLSPNVIADFRTWIEMGAPDPRVHTGKVVSSKVTAEDIAKGKEFWAFKKPRVTTPKTPANNGWVKNEIDRYALDRLNENQLKAVEDADAATLLRRLHFDLVGLPPTQHDLVRFESSWNANPDGAIAAEVDRLLEKPQFGERWGRHWLDIARFAESTGKEVDMTFPNAWRYRNYVIDAFNSDKPYDRFIQEQIAGDLLPAKTDEQWSNHLIATGFLALGPKALIEQNPRQFHADLIDEQIDTTTRVVLGISAACARCHDHKFDPIPQTDYYALAGIFESTETFYGGTRSQRNRQPSNLLILPVDDPNPGVTKLTAAEVTKLKEMLKEKETEYAEARRAMRQPTNTKPGTDPRRNFVSAAILDQIVSYLNNRVNSVDEQGNPLTFAMGAQDLERPKNARVLIRGEIDQPAQEVERGFLTVLSDGPVKLPAKSSGRLQLAKWMTSTDNPLTARVMANRIWQHMIGQPLVRETENFGFSGPGATHPEMLDYLAIQFMEKGWSIKTLIRQIATSRVYRLSAKYDPVTFELDPENLYLARANPRRLEAEALRDAMLAISGQLDLKRPKASTVAGFGSTLIGPNGPVIPPANIMELENAGPGALMALGRGGGRGNPLEAPAYYRSVYLPVVRNALPRTMDVFDFAEPSMVIGQRESSNTADQALYMLNNPFVIEQSDALARRLIKEYDSSKDRISNAFVLIYGRAPTQKELRSTADFFRRIEASDTKGPRDQRTFRALSQFCQALFSSAEFRFVN